MGKRVVNRRGKQSLRGRKNAFRSHDPELNKSFTAAPKGRNSAPARGDEAVLKTVLDIGVRNPEEAPMVAAAPTPQQKSTNKKSKTISRHEEMKRKGLEKRFLLAQLVKNESNPIEYCVPKSPSSDEESFVDVHTPSKHLVDGFDVKDLSHMAPTLKKFKKSAKSVPKTPGEPVSKKSSSSAPFALSKHTEHKRKKMRDREREKRQRVKDKKQRKMERKGKFVSQSSMSKLASKSSPSIPLDSIRELGSKLMTKFMSKGGRQSR